MSRRWHFTSYHIVACITLLISIAGPGRSLGNPGDQDSNASSPRWLLNQCLSTQSRTDYLEIDGITDITWTLPPAKNTQPEGSYKIEYHLLRNDTLIDVQYTSTSKVFVHRYRTTFSDSHKIQYRLDPSTQELPKGGIVWQKDLDAERRSFLSCLFDFGTPLDGYLTGDGRRIAEYLLEASDLHIVHEASADGTCIQGRTRIGLITMWLRPNEGYIPSRITIQKNADDFLCLTGRVSQQDIDPALRQGHLTEWAAELGKITAGKVNGVWVPSSGTLLVNQRYSNGGESKRTYVFKRSAITLASKRARRDFTTDLPRGTNVTFMDDASSGVKYKWDGNGVVKSARSPMAPDSRFGHSSNAARTIAVALGFIALAATGLWLFVRQK